MPEEPIGREFHHRGSRDQRPDDRQHHQPALHPATFHPPPARGTIGNVVRWLWERLLASGAVAWAKEEAKRLAQEGLGALIPYLDTLPGREATSHLQNLLTALVERRA